MKKIYYFSFSAFILGLLSFVLYLVIGSKISSDGTLIEPFFLIPSGFLLIAAGLIISLIASLWALFHGPKKFDKLVFGFSLALIIVSVLYLAASFAYLSDQAEKEISQAPAVENSVQIPLPEQNKIDVYNNTYIIDDEAVNLTNGKEEKLITDSKSKKVTEYFGNDVKGDFNEDGFEDTAFLLTQNSGGSGTFFYVAAAIGSKDGYIGSNALLLGDRIAPQSTEYRDGELIINYLERQSGDSFVSAPSVGVSRYFKLVNNSLVEVIK